MTDGTMNERSLPSTEDGWRQILTPEQFHILRERGTERAFTGKYATTKERGVYRCAGCGAELFGSATKFESGTGLPKLLRADLRESGGAEDGSRVRDAADGGNVRALRRPPRPRLRRRPPSNRSALLHELGGAGVGSRTGLSHGSTLPRAVPAEHRRRDARRRDDVRFVRDGSPRPGPGHRSDRCRG